MGLWGGEEDLQRQEKAKSSSVGFVVRRCMPTACIVKVPNSLKPAQSFKQVALVLLLVKIVIGGAIAARTSL